MPIAKFQMPDGRIGRFEVPEGTTPEQAQAMIQEYVSGPQDAPAAQEQPPQEPTGFSDRLIRQLGLTARAAGEGLAGTAGIVTNPVAAIINKILPAEHQLMPLKEATSRALTEAGVPQPMTDEERLAQAASQAVAGTAGFMGLGGALAGASQSVASGVGGALVAQPAGQLGGSIASGLASEKIRQEGGGALAQLAGGLGAGIAGAGIANIAAGTRGAPAQIPQEVKEAEKAGIKVMTSDVAPPGSFASKWLQAAGERMPVVGTGPVRAQQQEQRIDAVKSLLREYGATDAVNLSDDIMRDLSTKRNADLAKYSSMKGDIINKLEGAGDVPVEKTVQAIDDQISKLSSLRTQEVQPIISRLQDWKTAIQGQNLPNIEILRKQIGESFKAPEMASVRSTGEKALSSIYGVLRDDMGNFIKNNGDRRDITKWLVANKQLSALAGETEMGALKSVLKRGDATPEVINNMLFSKKPSEIRQLYNGLTPSGRATAQAAILSKAAQNVAGKGQSIDSISPDRFANEVKKLGNSVGVFFTGADANRVEGLQRALQLTKRGMEAGAAPPTGVQNWYAAMGIGGAGVASAMGGGAPGFIGAVTLAGGIGGAARIYESAPVRNLLIKIAQAPKGSEIESSLARRLNEVVLSQMQSENK